METSDLLVELFGRVSGHVHDITDGLRPEDLTARPDEDANPIGWLIWHLTRVVDGHVAELDESEQVWVEGDWGPRFGLDSDPTNSGFGHTSDQVAAVRPESAQVLVDYYDAVEQRIRPVLESATAAELDGVVDRRWDPPVTLGVRLVSIADDAIQHAGQAAYVKGLLQRR